MAHHRRHPPSAAPNMLRGLTSGVLLLAALTVGCTPAAPPIVYVELNQDYTTTPDGEHPARFDSGQDAVLTYAPDETAIPTIVSGRSVIAFDESGRGAGYATGKLSASAVYIEADWNFSASGTTDSGQLALGLYAEPLPAGFLGDTPTPDSPAHVVFLNDHFEYGVWMNGNLTVIANVPYERTFTDETQHAAVYIRKDLEKAWVLGPTGTIYGPFTDPSIGDIEAPYVTAEQFYGNAATDRRVEIQKWHATTNPSDVELWQI